MKQKPFSKLTDLQKVKVQEQINKAFDRTIKTIDFLEYKDNEDKKATIFIDSVDIFYKHVSNILYRSSFIDNLKAMFYGTDSKEKYLSNKF